MQTPANIFLDIPPKGAEELIDTLVANPNCRIERIVSRGHRSPQGFWYDQEQSEWVLLLAGAARLLVEEEVVEMRPGSYLNIPAHCRHRIEWTDPEQTTIWLAIHY